MAVETPKSLQDEVTQTPSTAGDLSSIEEINFEIKKAKNGAFITVWDSADWEKRETILIHTEEDRKRALKKILNL